MPSLKTDAECRAAKAALGTVRTDYSIAGAPALQLRVSRTGRKQWRVVSKVVGVVPLGTYPDITLSEARAAAATIMADAAREAVNREFGRPIMRVRDPRTVRDVLEQYEERRGAAVRSWAEQKRAIAIYYPQLMSKPARTVSRDDMLAPVLSNRNIASKRACIYLSAPMRWAKLGDVPSQSELNDIVAETARDRVLADDELRRVLTADVDELTRDLVWGLLLSCQRRGDLGAMQIEDVGDGGIWRFVVQKSRSREKVSHPLSQSMLELVARRAAGRSAGLVFASRAYAPAPPSNWSHRLTRLHRASQTANWAWHDLRRSGRSLLSRVGTPLEVAEKIMNHSVPGIVRIYDRYGFEAEMHAAYERLANALQGIAEGRVTVLDRRRRGSSDEAS